GVVVALVEAEPGNRLRPVLELAPGPQQRRLAGACRSGDDCQLDPRSVAKPLDETVAQNRLLPPRRRMQLRHQEGQCSLSQPRRSPDHLPAPQPGEMKTLQPLC